MSGIIPTPSSEVRPIAAHRRVVASATGFAASGGAPRGRSSGAVPSRFVDTPVDFPRMYAFTLETARMSAIKGRAKRADNAPTVLLQARVTPDVREEVQAAAAASGVSVAYYLDTFLRELVQMNGALPLVAAPRPQAEELPIPAA